MLTPGDLFTGLPASMLDEVFETLLQTSGFRVERIVSLGHASPPGFWYDQPTDEWVLVVSGSARIRFEGKEPVDMKPGSFINIPAHQRHRVEWTDPAQPTIWLAIHYAGPALP